MRRLLRRVRERITRRNRDLVDDHAAQNARAEAARRRDETYARVSRPPDSSGGGPFV